MASHKTKVPTILIISSAESEETVSINDNFLARLSSKLHGSVEVEWHNYQNVGIRMDTGEIESFVVSTGKKVHEYSAVYFKSYFRYHEQAIAIAESLQAHRTKFIGSELQRYIPMHKLSQMARLARNDFHLPKTLFLPAQKYAESYDMFVSELGNKFVFKAIDSSTGNDNYLIKTKSQFDQIVMNNAGKQFIGQSFVPNQSDLRLLVVGGKLELAIERRRIDDNTHLNNTSQGAHATILNLDKLPAGLEDIALRATSVMGRDIAGVDVILETDTNVPYVLEVNASPQIASGVFEDEKLAIYTKFFSELVK